ncbi:1-deoxy-D-xylulose-5-phosphate reductoisomerase, partial [Oleiphilus sp. HI0086]
VLGATGSIGLNTLDVISRHPDRYRVFALTAHRSVEQMLALCLKHSPSIAVMVDEDAAQCLQGELLKHASDIKVLAGAESLECVSAHDDVDVVMAAIVGAAGLEANLAAARKGKKVLLANKESLVMSGQLFTEEVSRSGATLLPIDSEHNAIFQCLPGSYQCGQSLEREVQRVLLTASGGPFRGWSRDRLSTVTPEQACAHPNWQMGSKISVDSATLMNKGLELIEACWLFDISPKDIEVHVHPESIVHSMVEYLDGSVIAQMGSPDMRTPIAYGLAWPERIASGAISLDLFEVAQLNFEKPDLENFPCLKLAQEAFDVGGTACTVLNAANEVAVASFLKGNVSFTAIPDIIASTLEDASIAPITSVNQILSVDEEARVIAQQQIMKKKRP